MKTSEIMCRILAVGAFITLALSQGGSVCAEDPLPRVRLPEGVYIDLTRDFYEALRDEGQRDTTAYTNDPSIEYLKEISICARFMVETNLQLLKQQERMIQLLDRASTH